jgi:hypothetical protein
MRFGFSIGQVITTNLAKCVFVIAAYDSRQIVP